MVNPKPQPKPAKLAVPRPLRAEHEELHRELARATREPGDIGAAAAAVAKVLHRHFLSEEQYALPPLGLLQVAARRTLPADAGAAVELADRLRANLPQMLQEHREIVVALNHLSVVAIREGKRQYAEFAKKLKLHAQTEEEVLYPAAILVGEYLKLRFDDIARRSLYREGAGAG